MTEKNSSLFDNIQNSLKRFGAPPCMALGSDLKDLDLELERLGRGAIYERDTTLNALSGVAVREGNLEAVDRILLFSEQPGGTLPRITLMTLFGHACRMEVFTVADHLKPRMPKPLEMHFLGGAATAGRIKTLRYLEQDYNAKDFCVALQKAISEGRVSQEVFDFLFDKSDPSARTRLFEDTLDRFGQAPGGSGVKMLHTRMKADKERALLFDMTDRVRAMREDDGQKPSPGQKPIL